MLRWAGDEHLVTVDCQRGYFELDKLTYITSGAVIQKLKEHFSRRDCPDLLVSDNASQYSSSLFKMFAMDWVFFIHETISPGNSQANGAAEGSVKGAKRILRKSHSSGEDPYIAQQPAKSAKYSNRGTEYKSGAETFWSSNQVDDAQG